MAARPPKQPRKPFQEAPPQSQSNNRGPNRAPAWRTNGGPSFANAARQNTNFPPLGGGQPPQQRPEYDPKLLASLASQTGNAIILNLKNGSRHEGIVVSTTTEGESVGVTLKNVKEVGNPSAPTKETFHFPAATCAGWIPVPKPNGVGHGNGIRTDTEISANANVPRERELRQWQPDPATDGKPMSTDEAFGALGSYSGGSWDQFEANEELFGVTTRFDEDAYTTKLDRSAPDFKERERKAQQLADEISRTTTNNPHVAEERQMNGGDNGAGEEEKYSAVVRGANAYVPPQARKTAAASGATTPSSQPASGPAVPPATKPPTEEVAKTADPAAPNAGTTPASTAKQPTDNLVGSFRDFVTNEKQRLTQRKQAIAKSEMDKRKADLVKFSKTFRLNKPIPEDLIPILTKDEDKQKAILEKAKADAEASLKAPPAVGSPSAPNGPRASLSKEVGANAPKAVKPAPSTSDAAPKKVKTTMYIQPIPPFDKSKIRPRPTASASGTPTTVNAVPISSAGSSAAATPATAGPTSTIPVSPTPSHATSNANANNAGFRLNATASTFRPNPTAPVFKPTSPAVPSPKVKDTKEVASPATASGPSAANATSATNSGAATPNAFFGTRMPPKKGAPVHLKDDFNPFRHAKVSEASAVSSMWQYSGKRFAAMFPQLPAPQPLPPAMPGVVPSPAAPPPYEEDPATQQAAQARQQPPYQQMMYYPHQYPYAAPLQPHGQPPMMLPGQAPTFMPGPYMQPMPYPHHMQPAPGMYGAPPNMPGVPPGPHYMAPPGAYPPTSPPPPAGTPRGPPGAMPGAPMPPHGYYHPSPPMGHAVPYQMMMGPPPQQPGPPHFDPSQGPPQVPPQVPPMAGAGH